MNQHHLLSQLINKYAKLEGANDTDIKGLRVSKTHQTFLKVPRIYNPCICILTQGSKQILLDEEVYTYSTSEYLAISVDLPLTGQVVEATPDKPYYGLQIDIDPTQISELLKYCELRQDKTATKRGLFVGRLDEVLYDAIYRLVKLLDTPKDIPLLAPMIMREVYYRLLQGAHGASIAQIAIYTSNAHRIADVIQKLKAELHRTISIDELAEIANMSLSSFHAHFKQITNMSPLQYQKRLRLTEARRLLMSTNKNAANIAYLVGYESASQFNREYTRLFGLPPKQDSVLTSATVNSFTTL